MPSSSSLYPDTILLQDIGGRLVKRNSPDLHIRPYDAIRFGDWYYEITHPYQYYIGDKLYDSCSYYTATKCDLIQEDYEEIAS